MERQDWDGAYYLVGYAVEYPIKVRMIAQLMKSDGFPEKKTVEKFYRHDLDELLRAAELDQEMLMDKAMVPHWDVVQDWSEQSRYELGKSERQARDLIESIEKGVLPWIKARW